jgi:hypothetical protein
MIGVFGDSYASPWVGNRGDLEYASWANNLGETAETYGMSATSQLWSYRKFLENHEKYDKIVFILTNSNRADHAGDNKDWSGLWAVNGYEKTLQLLKQDTWASKLTPKSHQNDKHEWNIPRVKALQDYIIHIEDDIADNLKSQLLVEGILSRRPDAVIIPIGEFHNLPNWTYLPTGTWCVQYQRLQMRSLFPELADQSTVEFYRKYEEMRCPNHFTPEINQLFAGHVKRALNGEGWQWWGIDHIPSIPHEHSWDYYYGLL